MRPGTLVAVWRSNGEVFITTTRSEPEIRCGRQVIFLNGISGVYTLDHVRPITGQNLHASSILALETAIHQTQQKYVNALAIAKARRRLTMPLYEYQCVDCGGWEQRVAGLDDHTAICVCGGLMLRLDEDLFHPYFDSTEGARIALGAECDAFELRHKGEALTKECCGDPCQPELCGQCWRLDYEMEV